MEQSGSDGSGSPGNTKRDSPAKGWVFTYNNYTKDEIGSLIFYFESINHGKYYFAEEIGKQGTPHLQGFVDFNIKQRFSALKKYNKKIHWEKRRATKERNLEYCSKEGRNYYTNMLLPRPIKHPSKWYIWQSMVLEIWSREPDNRSIFWFCEKTGNTGKSTLVNYLVDKKGALLLPNKTSDAHYMIGKYLDETNEDLWGCVFDVPRDSLNYINYSLLEMIKNGQILSGKYEGISKIIANPHVFIFANEPPHTEKMSLDRWHIITIDAASCNFADDNANDSL